MPMKLREREIKSLQSKRFLRAPLIYDLVDAGWMFSRMDGATPKMEVIGGIRDLHVKSGNATSSQVTFQSWENSLMAPIFHHPVA
jgi:hypothetical protein